MALREVDGVKVAFVEHEVYFAGLLTPSMHSTAKATGADMVFLLAPGVKAENVPDEDIREMINLHGATHEH